MISDQKIPDPIKEVFNFSGSDLTFELGHYAYKADAALTLQKGETVILATVGVDKKPVDFDFLPLSVEYIEKYFAGGIISSSRFIKRETRPSESAVLKARQIDHAIRSLFPKSWRKPVSVVITVLAYDGVNDPEQLAVIAASTALMLSSVPFYGPSASIKVSMGHDDQFVWAPTVEQEEEGKMDMIVSVVGDRILNIEGWADEVQDDVLIDMMSQAVDKVQGLLEFQKDLAAKHGRQKQEYADLPAPEEMIERVKAEYTEGITSALKNRETRQEEMIRMQAEMAEKIVAEAGEAAGMKPDTDAIAQAFEYVARKIVRAMALDSEERTSGRQLDEIRPLKIEVGVLPRVHGSAVFTRGVTQSLSILTLGSMRMAQTLESFEGEESKRFMHHYTSPNFSYGDAGRYSYYPGRREIGHGNIGENALRKMIPSEEVFPYTIRLSSEIMSSNGSTSMAATCASSLALLDGGVPIKGMVAGVALGLVTDDADVMRYKILTDMEDVEDFYGDMDFKVAGSENGVTAIQLDNKLKGIPVEILTEGFRRSKAARLEILAEMKKIIAEPRAELSDYAPKVDIVKIKQDAIGELIGPGGKMIKSILEACEGKVDIDIQETGDVYVTGVNKELREKALKMIQDVVGEAEIGKTYEGKVGKVAEYGVFVDVTPRISGLVHVSEMSDTFVKEVGSLYKEGDVVRVKVTGRDEKGRLKLSIKQADK